ncbi:MAG: glycosyltransferase family 39 protein [Patescibacteria group bacterium]
MSVSKFLNTRFLLSLICVFFLITRLYKISEIPPSVYWDEASIGYNAYSISQTDKDEWGDFLPIHFRAFGEFKLPVYIYSTALSVSIFGLNEFSVRIPSVLFSLGVVILTYLLAKKLTGQVWVGLWSAFFATISPWFFIFSRTGFEVTAGLMFYLLAIYLFLINPRNGSLILLSLVSFIFSAYSYNSFRIIAPLTIFILFFLEKENLINLAKRQLRWVILSLAIVAISIWPIYRLYLYDVGFFRLQAVGTVNIETFIKNYISHFSTDFLLNGDKNLRHQQMGFGQLYLPELVLFLLGVSYLTFVNSKSKYRFLPIALLLISPIPAALTKESPHALRALSMVPFISMISAIGLSLLRPKLKYLFDFGIVLVMLSFYINYFMNFINTYPAQSKEHWQYAYKNFFMQYNNKFGNYDQVLVSDQYAQPYIFALFYLKYDPEKFRKEVIRNTPDKWGFSTVKSFGRFYFGD